ncbi:MAG: hypothetical protein FWD53_00080 [Phycisphaerales bacterium]|nr:hypothetical protein [Phycisphaerales bacterium]
MRINTSQWRQLLLVMLMAWLLGACAKTKPTLVVTVGGMGYSQLRTLRLMIIQECPYAKVVNAGGWDGHNANLKRIAESKPRTNIIFIGHSFGCGAINEAAEKMQKLDLAVFIDPAWNDFNLSKNIVDHIWYQRSGMGIERQAQIVGSTVTPRTIKGGHNDIPHSPMLIAEVINAIHAIHEKSEAAAKAAETPPP